MDQAVHVAYMWSAPLCYTTRLPDGAERLEPLGALDVEADKQVFEESMTESGRAVTCKMEVATADTLRTFTTKGCRALHFTGHGLPQLLSFENATGGLHTRFNVDKLRLLFEAGATSCVQLVFVAACNSQFVGAAFAAAGVPHVVAVRCGGGGGDGGDDANDGLITDAASRAFTHAFYIALFVGKTVREAFDIGVARVSADPSVTASSDADKFLLLPEDSDHGVPVFADLEPGAWADLSPPVRASLPPVPQDFSGRQLDAFRLVKGVLKRRLVSLRGAPGVGKSALAVFTARFLCERRHFESVHYVSLAAADEEEAGGGGGEAPAPPGTPPGTPTNTTNPAVYKELAEHLELDVGLEAGELLAGAATTGALRNRFKSAVRAWSTSGARRQRACLLVLDNGDELVRRHRATACRWIGDLLAEAPRTRVVLVTRASCRLDIPDIAVHTQQLGPLGLRAAVQLFRSRVPALTAGEVAHMLATDPPGSAQADQSADAVTAFLGGNPRAITLAAGLADDDVPREQLAALLLPRAGDAGADEWPEHVRAVADDVFRCLAAQAVLASSASGASRGVSYPTEAAAAPPPQEQEQPSQQGEAETLQSLAHLQIASCEWAAALDSLTRAAALYAAEGAPLREGCALLALGQLRTRLGWVGSALEDLQRALQLFATAWSGASRRSQDKCDLLIAFAHLHIGESKLQAVMLRKHMVPEPVRVQGHEFRAYEAKEGEDEVRVMKELLSGTDDELDQALSVFRSLAPGDDVQLSLFTFFGWRPRLLSEWAAEGEAMALTLSGRLSLMSGHPHTTPIVVLSALAYYQAQRADPRDPNHANGEARCRLLLGTVKAMRGDTSSASVDFSEAAQLFEQTRDVIGHASALRSLGDVHTRVGEHERAQALLEQALPMFRALGIPKYEALTLRALGEVRMQRGDMDGARADLEAAMRLFQAVQLRHSEADTLRLLNAEQVPQHVKGRPETKKAVGHFTTEVPEVSSRGRFKPRCPVS